MTDALASRKTLLSRIIGDLECVLLSAREGGRSPIVQNLQFFRALHSRFGYLAWLVFHMRHIDGCEAKELSDILQDSSIGRIHIGQLQRELCALERQHIFNPQKLLRKEILLQLEQFATERRRVMVLDIGSGAMEVERQVILELRKKTRARFVFAGVDSTSESCDMAVENLRDVCSVVRVKPEGNSFTEVLAELNRDEDDEPFRVVIIEVDSLAFLQSPSIRPSFFDLAFSTQFKHHLPHELQTDFETGARRIARVTIEEDGIQRFAPFLLAMEPYAWNRPILLNGWLFSNLRYVKIDDLKREACDCLLKWDHMHYVKIFTKE